MHLLNISTDYVSVCIAEWFWIVQTRFFWVKQSGKIFLRNVSDVLHLLMGLVLPTKLELAQSKTPEMHIALMMNPQHCFILHIGSHCCTAVLASVDTA